MDQQEAQSFLRSLLNKPLAIYTNDNRIFSGDFKCTDNERNIILSTAHEYRIPTPPTEADFDAEGDVEADGKGKTITKASIPRYIGLIVVPGQLITRIEVEEWAAGKEGGGKKEESGAGSAEDDGEDDDD